MKILVTGAGGFVGTPLVQYLTAQGHEVVAITRKEIPDIVTADWSAFLQGVDVVIHLAARVHQMNDASADPLAAFRAVNRDATIALASAAASCGVKRLIFLSSVKAAVDETSADGVDETMPPLPASPYGISKLEGETALLAMHDIETVILRPPLIYGPGVKANFRLLMKLALLPIPLPLGAIDNRRSMLSIGNLLSAINLCLTAPDVVGKVFYLSDGVAVSTPQLLRMLGAKRLLNVPVWLLRLLARLLRQGEKIDRLTESLVVSNGAFCRATGWQPNPTAGELERLYQPLYKGNRSIGMEKATFGAGCFWGVEEAFRRLPGVSETSVGYLGGAVDQPTYKQVCTDTTGHAEVVQVTFDPAQVSYDQLLDLFWQIHDPTQVGRQGPDYGTQYRTAIFTHSPEQVVAAEASKQKLQESGKFKRPIATEITPASTYWKAEDYHQQYLAKRGQDSCHI